VLRGNSYPHDRQRSYPRAVAQSRRTRYQLATHAQSRNDGFVCATQNPIDISQRPLDRSMEIRGFPFEAMAAGGKEAIMAAGNRNSFRFARLGYSLPRAPRR
jgi:hypothetical protein